MRAGFLLVLPLAVACGGAATEERLALVDLKGVTRHPAEVGDARANVVIFITTDCPIANGYAPEVRSIVADHSPKGVRFFLVHVDPDVTRERAVAHAAEYGLDNCPILIDAEHRLVELTGATVTPEAVVWTATGGMAYRGRIDNWYADLGKKRRAATQHDLRDALAAVLAGEPVREARTEAVGCYIPD